MFKIMCLQEMVGTWATIRESIGLQQGASSRSSLVSAAMGDDDEEEELPAPRPVARPLAGSTGDLVRRAADALQRLGISDDEEDETPEDNALLADEGNEAEASDEPQEAHEAEGPSGSGGPDAIPVIALKEEEDDDDVCITAVNIEPARAPKRPSEMTEAEIRDRLGVVQRELKHRRTDMHHVKIRVHHDMVLAI